MRKALTLDVFPLASGIGWRKERVQMNKPGPSHCKGGEVCAPLHAFALYGTIAVSAGLLSLVMFIELKTAPGVVSAAPTPDFTDIERFQCVTEIGPAGTASEDGVYRTVMNVYNPHHFAVEFTKRAVIAQSERGPRGIISSLKSETLQAGQDMGIDCLDIQTLLGGAQPVGNGVIVIQASADLKVIHAYTQLNPLKT